MSMNPARFFVPRPLLSAVIVLTALPVFAQQAHATVTAAQLAKYDLNKNGLLDANELATLQADEAKAAATPVQSSTGPAADETVQLSPFEVREANNGYYAATTMSGTRLNTRIEDLASSISVVTKHSARRRWWGAIWCAAIQSQARKEHGGHIDT